MTSLTSSDWLPAWLRSGAVLSLPTGDLLLASGDSVIRSDLPSPDSISFFAPDFFLTDSAPYWIFQNFRRVSRSALRESLEPLLREMPPSPDWSPADRTLDFDPGFNDAQARFQRGELSKVVPVIFETADFEATPLWRAHRLARMLDYLAQVPQAFLYGIWNGAIGDSEKENSQGLIGVTPELLFEIDGNTLKTMALAGTRRAGAEPGLPDLLEDPKERREHQLVIEGIESTLKPWGNTIAGQTGTLKLPGLTHLYTPIELKSDRTLVFDEIVRALHPTPALGAWPKDRGLAWLQTWDSRARAPRKRFGAPFGAIFEDGQAQAIVAIRGLQWSGNRIQLSAGCGVIAESVASREWDELQAKINAVKRIFGL